MKNIEEKIGCFALSFALSFALAFIVFLPFVVIWSFNTLFLTNIEFTWKTWIACVFLIALIKSICKD